MGMLTGVTAPCVQTFPPCARGCAVVVGGRKMVAVSPLRKRGLPPKPAAPGGGRGWGSGGEVDMQTMNKASVK